MPEYDEDKYVHAWFFVRNKGNWKSCEYWILNYNLIFIYRKCSCLMPGIARRTETMPNLLSDWILLNDYFSLLLSEADMF